MAVRKLSRLILVSLLASLAWVLPGHAQVDVCRSAHSQAVPSARIQNAYSQAWGHPGIYIEERCHSNVIRLYQALKGQIPTLRPQDFQVLYITWPEGWLKQRDRLFSPQMPRRENQRKGLRYHVVLEYQGRIFDLDLADSSQVKTTDEYLRSFVRPEDRSSLVVHWIPGSDYLTWPVEYADRKEEFHRRIFLQTPTRPL